MTRRRRVVRQTRVDQHEKDLQAQLIEGPPPLGPGAPAADRLAAFYDAMLGLLDRHVHLDRQRSALARLAAGVLSGRGRHP